MKKTSIRLLTIGSLLYFVTGCFSISQYHLGYHNFGAGRMGYSVVSLDSVTGLEEFEERCVKGFAHDYVDTVKSEFAPNLYQAFDKTALNVTTERLKTYVLSGNYERLQVVPRKTMLDEAAGKDAFDYYDLVSANYLLKGNTDAVVRLYMTKINGNVRLAGFEIMDYDKSPNGKNFPPIKYIFPESIDKAGMMQRHHKKVE